MYDLNVCIPDISNERFGENEKFAMLKNYLYELNEVLSFALSDIDTKNLSQSLGDKIALSGKNAAVTKKLDEKVTQRFSVLKSDIIRAADEVFESCSSEIERSDSEIRAYVGENYTALSQFGEYTSRADSLISQNADAITQNAARVETVGAGLENYKNEVASQFTVSADAVISETEKNFVKKDELDDFSETVSSKIVQTATEVTENFSTGLSVMRDDLTTLGGEMSELVSSLEVYIRRGLLENGDYGIEIGRSDSGIKARFTNERISFCLGDGEVAYISGTDLYITRARVLDYLEIGNSSDGYFKLDVTANGLEVRWSYGD